jgi:Tfp pilus assembly protein PilO
VNAVLRSRTRLVRVAAARLHQRVGLAGLLGLGLLLVAALTQSLAWRQHQRSDRDASVADLRTAGGSMFTAEQQTSAQLRTPASMPPATDIPLLLTRIQRAAIDAGLGWPKADYRFNPATQDTPASLEVQCALKGPYPAVRQFVTALLQDTPTLTLREFSLSRTNTNAPDVDAKLAIVVYLASDATPGTGVPR